MTRVIRHRWDDGNQQRGCITCYVTWLHVVSIVVAASGPPTAGTHCRACTRVCSCCDGIRRHLQQNLMVWLRVQVCPTRPACCQPRHGPHHPSLLGLRQPATLVLLVHQCCGFLSACCRCMLQDCMRLPLQQSDKTTPLFNCCVQVRSTRPACSQPSHGARHPPPLGLRGSAAG